MRFFKKLLILVALMVVVHYAFFRAPSEAQMIAHFRAHKTEFEQLRAMLQQDEQVLAIGDGWVSGLEAHSTDELANADISKQRLVAYRALMEKLGVAPVMRSRSHENYFRFSRFGGGFTDTSWSVGYAWSKSTPRNLVASAYPQNAGTIYRGLTHSRIEGNWYIFQNR